MVLNKQGEMLYKGVQQLVTENLDKLSKDQVVPAFPAGGTDDPMQQTQEGEMLLKALKRIWDDHTSSMTRLGQILKYMVASTSSLAFQDDSGIAQRIEFTLSLQMFRKSGTLDSIYSSSTSYDPR